MKTLPSAWLVSSLLALVLASACLDTATNDDEILPPVGDDSAGDTADGDDASSTDDIGDGKPADGSNSDDNADGSAPDGDGSAPNDDGSAPNDDGSTTDGATDGSGTDEPGTDDESEGGPGDGVADDSDGGEGSDDEGSGVSEAEREAAVAAIVGSAKASKCTSYTPASDSTCYGYYCGVSEAMLKPALSPSRKCDFAAADICAGTLSTKVAACARSVKSNPLNAFASDADIRKKTQECVYQDAKIKSTVSGDCLGCYLDGAMCASKNCVSQCLTGDSANCDACRMENNCNQPVPGCAELPSPF